MPKFSGKTAKPNLASPMRTTGVQTHTYEGGIGYERDAKTELFLLAVTNMVAEDTFYESARDRDGRFADLAHQVTQEDPEWIRNFIPYLRNTMQMRSASIVLAAHYVHAGGPNSRRVVDSAMSRADEPAEILAYWTQTYGKNFPQPLKRGVADAIERLYNQYSALKYDGQSRAWRMGDVIQLVHPKPIDNLQSALYKYLLDTRYNNETHVIEDGELPTIAGYLEAMNIPVELRRGTLRSQGIPQGMTWESLSGWLQSPMDAEAWEAVIPNMGYMALLRNLRNFEDAGISEASQKIVRDKLTDPDEVAKSRQFPIRFYSAWKAVQSLTWGRELETALDLSVKNVPEFRGKTLILIDLSGSMDSTMSGRTDVLRYEIAAVFGAAIAKRNPEATLVGYSDTSVQITPARSVLQTVDKIVNSVRHGGTQTWQAFNQWYDGHDRTIIITDEQAHPSYSSYGGYYGRVYEEAPTDAKRGNTPLYTFNVAGYKAAHIEQGQNGSYVFGGLTDAGFTLIKSLEDLRNVGWPWES